LIPGKIPTVEVQKCFITMMEALYNCAINDEEQVLLFLDPMHQIHNNENDYTWQLKGIKGTRQVLVNTGRKRFNIIGAINPVTLGPTIILTEENCSAEVIEAFLEEVKKQYNKAKTICIILDNARYQRSNLVQTTAKFFNIDLLYLPPYSPNLNLIERLWRFFKKEIIKNKYYADYATFEKAVETFFTQFGNRKEDLRTLLNFKFGIIKAI
jgi:transposase